MQKNITADKKIELLKKQLLGKQQYGFKQSPASFEKPKTNFSLSTDQITPSTKSLYSPFLKKDLQKILILSALAIAFQLCLYWSLEKGYLKFPLGY